MAVHYDESAMRRRLISVLEDRSLSMREVSLGANLSESYLSGVLKLGRDPQLSKLIAVCEYLEVSVTWALYGYEVPQGADEILMLLQDNPDMTEMIASLLRAKVA